MGFYTFYYLKIHLIHRIIYLFCVFKFHIIIFMKGDKTKMHFRSKKLEAEENVN